MKNLYGVTPWGAWFLDVLDSYKMGERLERGRRYANAGKVLSLEMKGGRVTAKVEGKTKPFYKVSIVFPPLDRAIIVYRMIEKDLPLMARIAAGELPESFILQLKERRIDLIPQSWHEMKRSCTCPDWGNPCKHMAALYYIIAREIDADQHVLFRLRGIDLEDRFGKAAVHTLKPPFKITYTSEPKAEIKDKPNLEPIPHCAELITSLLPPDPPFSEKNFAAIMAEFYHFCSAKKTRAWEPAVDSEALAKTEHDFSRSHWSVISPTIRTGSEHVFQVINFKGLKRHCSVYEAYEQFVQFSSDDGTSSYTYLFYLFKFLNLICESSAFIPYVSKQFIDPSNYERGESVKIIWRPFESLPLVANMLKSVASIECGMYESPVLFKINPGKKKQEAAGKQYLSGQSVTDILSSAFLNEWIRRKYRKSKDMFGKQASEDFRRLINLFFYGFEIDISRVVLRSLPVSIDKWLSVLHINFSAYRYAITIKDLKKNYLQKDDEGNEVINYNFSISMDYIDSKEEGDKIIPLSKCKDLDVLRAPVALSNYLPEIRRLTESRKVNITEPRLAAFLDSASSLLSRLGMTVNLPKSLARELKPRLVVKGSSKGGSLVHYLDLNSLQKFEWKIAIGDEVLSFDEFRKLVNEKRALVRFKDGFVKMDADEFSRLLKNAKNPAPNVNDFLKAHFSGDSFLDFDMQKSIDNLFKEHNFPIPSSLTANLRPYQKRGYDWICSLLFSGFGCILADDMGLGKTVQSIAALLRLKEEGLLKEKCLLVAPAALLNNWEKELDRFAPSLKVSRYHGKGSKLDRKSDIFLTTYQTAVRDSEKLNKENFSLLLVDEAHLMKNAETRVSRTVKHIQSRLKLALSGTPVENRLEDLRSLFDFILPGYLGEPANFKEEFRIPIEVMRNSEKAEELKKITSPFLLRRVKTDKDIIKDLPEKITSNEYAVLEKEQAALYETVVAESIDKSEKLDSKERLSLIFSLLTSLKQICDHPRVFDKESPAISKLSGKAQLLVTLLTEILRNQEKTLVFSQYVETLDCLHEIIKNEMGEKALIYHGGLNQNLRSDIVNQFQEDPSAKIMLVSLKAGGLGLNLTAASRVIHYDLWYNPAVENQATDRAFRIGQKRTVFVHRFITKNSFEEKIDAMITSKKELADMTVASGESWLSRMSHSELKDLFDR